MHRRVSVRHVQEGLHSLPLMCAERSDSNAVAPHHDSARPFMSTATATSRAPTDDQQNTPANCQLRTAIEQACTVNGRSSHDDLGGFIRHFTPTKRQAASRTRQVWWVLGEIC